MKIPDAKTLKFWIENKWNVLMTSEKGVGKSAIITDAFNEAYGKQGEDWLYFSAATLDPWVDFVGIPRIVTDPETGVQFIDLVRPKAFAYDKVKAIFFDEYNRAPTKVLNATMELLQFKSINGHRFEQLEVVWAAVNPADPDKTYAVETLDPAHTDRFIIQISIDSQPDKAYFAQKYPHTYAQALEWWAKLGPKLQKHCSPRRLDYALEVYEKGGSLKHVLDEQTNPSKLIDQLKVGPIRAEIKALHAKKDYVTATAKLAQPNYFAAAKEYIFNPECFDFFVPCIPKEEIGSHISPSTIKRYENLAKMGNRKVLEVLNTLYITPTTPKALKSEIATLISQAPTKPVAQWDTGPIEGAPGTIAAFVASQAATPSDNTYMRYKMLTDFARQLGTATNNNTKPIEGNDLQESLRFLENWAERSQTKSIEGCEPYQKIILPILMTSLGDMQPSEILKMKSAYTHLFSKCAKLNAL